MNLSGGFGFAFLAHSWGVNWMAESETTDNRSLFSAVSPGIPYSVLSHRHNPIKMKCFDI